MTEDERQADAFLQKTIRDLRAENERLESLAITDQQSIERHRAWLVKAEADNERLRAVLPFFRSVILSGEPWTDVCEQHYRKAMGEQ